MTGDGSTQTAGLRIEQGKALLWLARDTIARQLGQQAGEPDPDTAARLLDQELQQRRGIFVTLKEHGGLRGCIGSLAALDSIVDGVKRNALNAAFHDPRFKPVGINELAAIEVEISILTEPTFLAYANSEDLIRTLRVGIDGVIIQKEGHSATFLPQVWEQLPRPADFLGQLCCKAGLPAEAWQSGSLEVFIYQVQYFVD